MFIVLAGWLQQKYGRFIVNSNILLYYMSSLLVSERSKRDTIRGVQIRAGAVYIYIYICMEVRMP